MILAPMQINIVTHAFTNNQFSICD